jgi:uncharacterized protein YkwD
MPMPSLEGRRLPLPYQTPWGDSGDIVEDVHDFRRVAVHRCLLVAVLIAAGTCLLVDVAAIHAAEPGPSAAVRSDRKAGPGVGPTGTAVAEHHIVVFTNETRARNKLAPLRESDALKAIARNHSEHMCETRSLLHESSKFPKGWGRFSDRLRRANVIQGAENIAYVSLGRDAKAWAKTVVDGWMQSPRHRKQILDARFRYLGVGVKLCPDRLGYATQVFSPEPGKISRGSESDSGKRAPHGPGKAGTVN